MGGKRIQISEFRLSSVEVLGSGLLGLRVLRFRAKGYRVLGLQGLRHVVVFHHRYRVSEKKYDAFRASGRQVGYCGSLDNHQYHVEACLKYPVTRVGLEALHQ